MAEQTINNLTPSEYFQYVKDRRSEMTDATLDSVYSNALHMMNKHMQTGQMEAFRKVAFHLESVEKEREIIKQGVNTFVYREDVEKFVEDVEDRVVVIKELRNYPREIPDEVVEQLQKVKELFDKFYVVFTDYTGEERKKVEEYRRAKDPILFGVFQDSTTDTMVERFYYIGDWEDPYCDLTLDKMVSEAKRFTGNTIEHDISTPETLEKLRSQVLSYKEENDKIVRKSYEEMDMEQRQDTKPEGFFSKVKTFIRGRKQ